MDYKIHPTADIQTRKIGQGTTIWQFCVILPGAKIGKDCNINCHVFIENDVIIGDEVTIKPGVQIWDGVYIGNKVFIGPNVTFTNDLIPRSKQYPDSFAKTRADDGASIGANATIIAGITLGKYSFVGAGSVITKSINPFTVWYGNPARHMGYITKDGNLVSLDLIDKEGNKYDIINYEPIKL